MTTRRVHQWVDTRTTSGAATATFSDPTATATPSGSAIAVRARFAGRDAATGNAVRGTIEGCFKNVAGTVSLEGSLSTADVRGNAALTGATFSLDVSTNVVVAKATGVGGINIDWAVHVEWLGYAP